MQKWFCQNFFNNGRLFKAHRLVFMTPPEVPGEADAGSASYADQLDGAIAQVDGWFSGAMGWVDSQTSGARALMDEAKKAVTDPIDQAAAAIETAARDLQQTMGDTYDAGLAAVESTVARHTDAQFGRAASDYAVRATEGRYNEAQRVVNESNARVQAEVARREAEFVATVDEATNGTVGVVEGWSRDAQAWGDRQVASAQAAAGQFRTAEAYVRTVGDIAREELAAAKARMDERVAARQGGAVAEVAEAREEAVAPKVTVQATALNLRAAPGMSGDIVGTVQQGAQLTLTPGGEQKVVGGVLWVQVQSAEGGPAWAAARTTSGSKQYLG